MTSAPATAPIHRRRWAAIAVGLSLSLAASGCSGNDDEGSAGSEGSSRPPGSDAPAVDLEALGLWDDGPCDTSAEPLKIGIIATFASPVITATGRLGWAWARPSPIMTAPPMAPHR